MATTQKGIYYPDDYTAVADVPEDMKDLAESVDTALDTKVDKEEGKGLSTYNFGTVSKGRLDSLWQGKATVDSDIARIKATFPTTTGSGENVTLDKTAELEFIQPPLPGGNSEQDNISYIDVGTWEQGSIDGSTGTTFNSPDTIRTVDFIPVKANILYNLSRNIYTKYMGFRFYDANKNYLGSQATSGMVSTNQNDNRMANGVSSMTMTILNSNVAYMKIIDNNVDLSIVYTISTASPNPSYPQEITNVTGDAEVLVQNKNKLITSTFVKGRVDNGVIGYADGTTSITSTNNSLTITTNAGYRGATSDWIEVDENTNCIYSQQETISGYGIRIACYDSSKTFIADRSSVNFTTPANTKYIRFCYLINVASTVTITNPMIRLASANEDYTPHKEQPFTFPLGTQRMYLGDYLADDGIHHVRKQVVFDGSSDEGWRNDGQEGHKRVRIDNSINAKTLSGSGSIANALCNYYILESADDTFAGKEGIAINRTGTIILIFDNNFNYDGSATDYKTWLSTHNLILEYELATEEITPYTTEQQTAYDEIKQALSYEEQTNISGTSDESNPLLNVEAYQSTKLILEEISNAVVALGGV